MMSNHFAAIRRTAIFAALCCLFSTTVPAQNKLRDALDSNGDDRADFTVFRPSTNTWFTLFSDNSGSTANNFGLANSDFMTPGDYDGDGRGDLSVWRDTDGVHYRILSSTNTFVADPFGASSDEPVNRDYDGDGKTDLAVVRRSNGTMTWFIFRSTDLGFSATQFGLATDFTAPGDYDGDGRFDVAIQRPGATPTSQAVFYAFRSSDSGFMIAGWGFGNDLVVPGDYDGDGKTDLAVVREGANPTDQLVWYINRSSDGNAIIVPFGLSASDYSVQNDYDGDGKTDIAIWRDTTGQFFYFGSLAGNVAVVPFGSTGDYPVAGYDTH